MILNGYGITVKPITFKDLQANTILERVYQTIGNILRTFKLQNMVLDDKNSMGQHIGLHHVCPRGYSAHSYSVHSCLTNI